VGDYDGFDPQRQRTAPSMRSPDFQIYTTEPHPKAREQVCVALLCLSQSESLSQFAQLVLENTTCQTLPCPTQPSPSITLCAVRAINAAQGLGSRSSSYFCSYKVVFTNIGRSTVCQTEGKGFYTVPERISESLQPGAGDGPGPTMFSGRSASCGSRRACAK
jgi:hypothetical protein